MVGHASKTPASSNVSRIAQVLSAVRRSSGSGSWRAVVVVGSGRHPLSAGSRKESWIGSRFPPGKTIAEEKDIDFALERWTRRMRFWESRRRREAERRGVGEGEGGFGFVLVGGAGGGGGMVDCGRLGVRLTVRTGLRTLRRSLGRLARSIGEGEGGTVQCISMVAGFPRD